MALNQLLSQTSKPWLKGRCDSLVVDTAFTTTSLTAATLTTSEATIEAAGGGSVNLVAAPTAGTYTITAPATSGTMLLSSPTGIPVPPAAAGNLLAAQVTLSYSQIQNMYNTPVLILASPGPGTLLMPCCVFLNYVGATGAGAVAFSNGGALSLQWGSTSAGLGTLVVATIAVGLLTGGTTNQTLFRGPFNEQAVSSNTVGAGIYLSNTINPFTAGTGGTSNGSLTVSLLCCSFANVQ
jgi:hypothetical protein